MKYFCFSIILFLGLFHIGDQTWWPKWALLLSFIAVYFAIHVGKKTHWICGLAAGYTILSGLWVATWRINQYKNQWAEWQLLNLSHGVFYALVAFILLTFWFSNTSKEERKWVGYGLAFICMIDVIFTLYQLPLAPNQRTGLMSYGAMNGCFIAMTIPLTWQYLGERKSFEKFFGFLIPLLAVIISDGSMPFGVLAAVLITFGFCRIWDKFYGWERPLVLVIALVAVCSFLVGLGYYLHGELFFDSSGRFDMYQKSFEWMKLPGNLYWSEWFGTGNGTYITIGKRLLGHFWMHSDIGQTYFELGAVGVIIYGGLFGGTIWRFWKRGQVFYLSSMAGWLACALFNYPVHLAMTSVVGIYLVREAYTE